MSTNPNLLETKVSTDQTDVFLPNRLNAPLTRIIGDYLDDITHLEFARGLIFVAGACDLDVTKRKQAREKMVQDELLPNVFEGLPKFVERFLQQKDITPLTILTDTFFDEGDYSYNQRFEAVEFVRYRHWPSITPLQAAACTGDKFILEKFLEHILQDPRLIRDALLQLEAVEQGISDQKLLLEIIDTLVKIEFDENNSIKQDAKKRLSEILASQEYQTQMAAFVSEMEVLRAEALAKKEGKETITFQSTTSESENAPDLKSDRDSKSKLTGDNEFLSAVIKLLKAYVYFCIQRPMLTEHEDALNKLSALWEIVGECQKNLYHYIKQEFFDFKNFKPFGVKRPQNFTAEPARDKLEYCFGNLFFKLDDIGFGTTLALYKFAYGVRNAGFVVGQDGQIATENANAIAHLYRLRLAGLRNSIQQLKTDQPVLSSKSTSTTGT